MSADNAYKGLFIKCFILQVLFNTCYTVFVYNLAASAFSDEDFIIIGLILGGVQIVLSFFMGLYLRRKNKMILLKDEEQRKKYARIALAIFVFVLFFLFNPNADILEELWIMHTKIIRLVYEIFGLRYSFTVYDFFSLGLCLCTVFLKRKNKS